MVRIFIAMSFCLQTSCQVMLPEAARTARLARLQATQVVSGTSVSGGSTENVAEVNNYVDELTIASACLEDGKDLEAVPHFLKHIQQHPEQIMIRAYLAELLYRLKRHDESRHHFERFVIAAEQEEGPARNHLVHCHTRLMEQAIQRKDLHAEHLHRGIGLFLLAQVQWQAKHGDAEVASELFCKAVIEFKDATEDQPNDAKAWWYLHQIWTYLNQQQAAKLTLQKAKEALAYSKLTPAEEKAIAAKSW
jgi:tetratricopeptide (TPR) repeat protein